MDSNEAASSSPVTKVRRIRKVVDAPPAPKVLQHQVDKAAKIIQRHQKVLGTVGIEALRVATLQVVAQKLSEIQALLQANGLAAGPVSGRVPVAAPPTGPSCAICGRPGVYQSRTARVEKGQQRPWGCEVHGVAMKQEDLATKQAERVMPAAPPAGSPNIGAALDALDA